MTAAGSGRDGAESDDADRIRDAVLGCRHVAALATGAFGEVASYLPGRKVAGVRVDDDRVEVHIVATYGHPLREVADEIGQAVAPLLSGRSLSVAVDDILLPGEDVDQSEPAGETSPVD